MGSVGRIPHYKVAEEAGKAHFDGNEGVAGIYQADRIQIVFGTKESGEIVITSDNGLVGHVLVSADYETPVFCLHAIHTGEWNREFTEAELPYFKRHLEMDKKMDEFGSHVWVIHNGEEFSNRLRRACIHASGVHRFRGRHVRQDSSQ